MSSISATNGLAFLQSVPTTGNWLLDAGAPSSFNWMDPNYKGPDQVVLAANAFAKVALVKINVRGSIAVNQGIATMQAELKASTPGRAVNLFV